MIKSQLQMLLVQPHSRPSTTWLVANHDCRITKEIESFNFEQIMPTTIAICKQQGENLKGFQKSYRV
jgi:hypothetical protein